MEHFPLRLGLNPSEFAVATGDKDLAVDSHRRDEIFVDGVAQAAFLVYLAGGEVVGNENTAVAHQVEDPVVSQRSGHARDTAVDSPYDRLSREVAAAVGAHRHHAAGRGFLCTPLFVIGLAIDAVAVEVDLAAYLIALDHAVAVAIPTLEGLFPRPKPVACAVALHADQDEIPDHDRARFGLVRQAAYTPYLFARLGIVRCQLKRRGEDGQGFPLWSAIGDRRCKRAVDGDRARHAPLELAGRGVDSDDRAVFELLEHQHEHALDQ